MVPLPHIILFKMAEASIQHWQILPNVFWNAWKIRRLLTSTSFLHSIALSLLNICSFLDRLLFRDVVTLPNEQFSSLLSSFIKFWILWDFLKKILKHVDRNVENFVFILWKIEENRKFSKFQKFQCLRDWSIVVWQNYRNLCGYSIMLGRNMYIRIVDWFY